MDNQKKAAVYGKYIRKCETFAKNTLSAVEKTYTDTASEKNSVAAVGAAAVTLIRSVTPLMYFIASFLLSGTHLVIGTYPMGIAFVSAVGKRMLWAYAGAVLSALTSSAAPAVDIAVYTLIVCLRRLSAVISEPQRKLTDFEDSLKLKLAVSLIAASALGAFNSIESGFTVISLAALIVYIAVTPSLTFLYACSVSHQKYDATALYRETSLGTLTVSLVMSLRTLAVGAVNPAAVAAVVVSLYITRRHGILKGTLIGLFLGLSGAPALTPVYSVAAIVSGLLFSSSPYLAAASATLAAVSWTVYAGGYAVATATAPSLIIGGVAATIGIYGGFFNPTEENPDRVLPHSAVLRAEMMKNSETDALLSSEAKAFTELSDMLYRLSDKLCKPTSVDVKESVRKCRASICRKCDAEEVCRKLNGADISDAWELVAHSLYEQGTLTEDDIPHVLSESCRHSDDICDKVNESYASMLKNLIDTDKTEIMALDYRAAASVLSDIIERRSEEFSVDTKLSADLALRLREEKITARQVTVYGGKKKTVFLSSLRLSGLHIGEDDLRRIASEVCGGEFSSPEFELHGSEINATLHSTEAFSVIHASARLTEEESRACGDSCLCFSSDNGHFRALISDGMGSGHEAAVTSGMCTLFIEKMLSAGNSAAVTLKMLNSMLRAKGSECSATVDLCDFDLITGEIDFYKSGASPTLIVRGSEIFRIESRTLPVGIIRSLDAQKTKIKAEIGDVIVMVSDGIAESDEDAAWLYSLVSEYRDRKCADIASVIIEETERRYNKKDDATVCVIRVAPPSKKEFNV